MQSYGTVKLVNGYWKIRTQPHVALRLKRVFGRIDKSQVGVLSFQANPESSRDLQWFLQRYPHEVDPEDALVRLADKHRETETVVEQLLKGTPMPLDLEGMKMPPRDYQIQAAQMWRAVGGLLLGDEVGVGKTASALTGLMQPGMLPALVVTLAHLPTQWAREAEKFTGLTTHILKKAQPYDFTKEYGGRFPDLIITNYHKLSGWADTFANIGLKAVVFDEAHELRHRDTAKYKAAKRIAHGVPFRLGLTATPIFNYGSEIFNVIDVLKEGALGTYEEFFIEWCMSVYGDKVKIKNPAAFGAYLREAGLMLRRTRKEIKRELPPVTIVPHTIDTDTKVLTKIAGEAVELARLVLSQKEDFKGQKMQASGEFSIKMRQATGVSKAKYVAEFVKFLHEESGEKIVLYGWHREVYDIWLKELKHLKPVMYTGSESPSQKDATREAFVNGDAQVMIISLRAGAGLDGLQNVCHIGVIGELDYSPAVHIQNTGRIDRDGQEEPVVMYYLIAEHGSDPVIADILGVKRPQLEGINNPTEDLIETLQIEADYIKKLARDYLERRGEVWEEAA